MKHHKSTAALSPANNLYEQVIALTGSIGSGKSTVAKLFAKLGASVVDADQLSRKLTSSPGGCLEEIKAEFGSSFFSEENILNRQALALFIFNNPEAKIKLERILHPKIKSLAENEFQQAIAQGSPIIIYECPLLFEAQLNELPFKAIIVVYATNEQCLQRAAKRDSLSLDAVILKLNQQKSLAEKVKQADIIIDNTGTLEQLEQRVIKVFRQLGACDTGS